MQDTKLFETILGIPTPWHCGARRAETRGRAGRRVGWSTSQRAGPVPTAARRCPPSIMRQERTWRHLDTCQCQTHLHAEIPRVQCPTHGVKQVRVPWAEPRRRFTGLLERLIIDLILQCSTVKGACAIAGVSWDEGLGRDEPAPSRGATRGKRRGRSATSASTRRRSARAIAITRSCATSSGRPSSVWPKIARRRVWRRTMPS